MRKSILSLFLVLCMVLSMLPATIFAASVVESGTCGDDLTWTLDDEGTLTISGTGEMYEYYFDPSPWSQLRMYIKQIVFQTGVTNISAGAFTNCDNLISISIPNSVTSIDNEAFYGCNSLSTLSVPKSVTSIDAYAFEACTALSSVTLSEGLISIGTNAFSACNSLKSITIPKSVTYIDSGVFSACWNMDSICFVGDVPEFEDDALKELTAFAYYPAGNPTWTEDVMQDYGGSITWVVMPEDCVAGNHAFTNYIPDKNGNCQKYGTKSAKCDNCGTIDTIKDNVAGGHVWNEENVCLFCGEELPIQGTCGDHLVWTLDQTGTLTISGTGAMYNYAYPHDTPWSFYTTMIESVNLEEGITTIGDCAFGDCSNVESMVIPTGVTSIGKNAFRNCGSLLEITLPDTVTSIGEAAFAGCNVLMGLVIPASVTHIGAAVFDNPRWLATVIFKGNAPEIGAYAFTGVDADVFYPADNSTWTADVMQNYGGNLNWVEGEFYACGKGTDGLTWSVDADGVLTVSGNGDMFYDYANAIAPWYDYGRVVPIREIIIESGVTSIGQFAFSSQYTPYASRIEIADTITKISYGAFYGNKAMETVMFKGDAPQFEENVFADITATVYYPVDNATWTENVMQNYGGTITWVPYEAKVESVFSYCNDTMAEVFGKADAVELKYPFSYDDAWFLKNSAAYNHELAQMSLRAALAAFNASTPQAKGDNAYYIKRLMKQLGYTYSDNSIHYPDPNRYTIGCAIGSKNISCDTSVVMVAVRGAGYQSEWSSNVTVGKTGDHQGFDEASIQVGDALAQYLDENKGLLNTNVKIWIFGYSRAAAVANLAAADLNDGFIDGISSDDVFAYCFACPQGTVDSNAASQEYQNIKCIVNPIDFVPKVAMNRWSFKRYGTTYYLPFAAGTSNYPSLKSKMMEEYKTILKYNGVSSTDKLNRTVRSLTVESDGQAVAFSDIASAVADLIGNRSSYCNKLESKLVSYIDGLMGDGWSDAEILDGVFHLLVTLIVVGKNLDDIVYNIADINMLYPDLVSELSSVTNLMTAHYPELYLAWMDSLNGDYKNYNGKYLKVLINCPVDINVYDESQRLVAQILDDEVQNTDTDIATYIDVDEQKVILLPYDATYEIKITATDDGTMSYSVEEWNMEDNSCNHITSYYDVKINTGDNLTGFIPQTDTETIAPYTLVNADGEILTPSKTSNDSNIATYFVNVLADGHGTVSSVPRKIEGEYVVVYAYPNDGESFVGWYSGEELVSLEQDYRFRVESDISLTAKFTKQNHSSENGTILSDPTCTESGFTSAVCNLCGDTYTAEIAALGHDYTYTLEERPEITKPGKLIGKCSRCTDKEEVILPQLNTTDYTYAVTQEPSDTESGVGTYTWNDTTYGIFVFEVEISKLGCSLSGIITSFGDEEGVVTIQLIGTEENAVYSTTVIGNSAEYSITDVAPGTYTLQISKTGHAVGRYTVTLDTADVTHDVTIWLYGDVNSDGVVNAHDRVFLARYLAKWTDYPASVINMDAADVNGDGAVNAHDRVYLARHLAKWSGYETLGG